MLDRLVVPLDGSAFAEAAVPLAVSLAEKTRGEILLVHVHEIPQFAVGGLPPHPATAAEGYLESVAERSVGTSTIDVHCEVRDAAIGEGIADGIASAVRGFRADTVVMTTHGRGGMSRVWMGSVADRFLRASPVRVLLVRPSERADRPHAIPAPRRIVVPLDGSERAEAAIPHGESLARAFGTSVLLLEVLTYPGAPNLDSPEQGAIVIAAEKEALARLRLQSAEVRKRGVDAGERVVRAASAASEILREADGDPIVMAPRGRGGLSRAVPGSVADKVVRGAAGLVMVVPPEVPAD